MHLSCDVQSRTLLKLCVQGHTSIAQDITTILCMFVAISPKEESLVPFKETL